MIALIGLVGLVSFMVTAKTKEIGVRKVLGAEVVHITGLLSKEFMCWCSWPMWWPFRITWYFSERWLQRFAYRSELNFMLFVWTMLIALAVTVLAVGYQTIKAAIADPVKSLRYE